MANTTSDSSHTKSTKPNNNNNNNLITTFFSRKTHLYYLIALLCLISYLIGAHKNSGTGILLSAAPRIFSTAADSSCHGGVTTLSTSTTSTNKLDFDRHHGVSTTNDTIAGKPAKEYPRCDVEYSEYTPCEDRERSRKYQTDRMVFRERHCPVKGEALKCRIPAPFGYRNPFPWPRSRDVAWVANVPHRELTVEKAVQNWIRYEGERFRFPGGGTMFPKGADAYIDDIGKLINLRGGSIRTAVDTGCGVASWGAYLLSREILTMSIAPRDSHEAQVQFALERGVPALIGILASKRLPFPSRAFDMAHCSRCLIPWAEYDGLYLNEVDRILRPGGYWILSGPPINWKKHWQGWQRTREDLNDEQTKIENVAKSLCWNKVIEKDDFAIWQKPLNHFDCKSNRQVCRANNPDDGWYADLQTCLSPLPEVPNREETSGGGLNNWPKRLNAIPPRILKGTIEGLTAETFNKDTTLWEKRVSYYKSVNSQIGRPGRYRNLLDMNAYLGGFASALIKDPVWVMNVVPPQAQLNTLGAIYERGLIGTYHDWCEAMSTYPRTYDLIHADSVFTLYNNRCEMEDILLEMDRILRPEGTVIIRDDVDVLVKVMKMVEGMEWETQLANHEDGPLEREKVLFVVKKYWTAPKASN